LTTSGRCACCRSVGVPSRDVCCLTKQSELLRYFIGRDLLPSTLKLSALDGISAVFRYYEVIRLLLSLRHLVVSFSTTTVVAEARRPLQVRTRNFVPTPSPIRSPTGRKLGSLP
jgi:hypothetical protein